ncbi:MAG: hypothetical protein OQK22_11470 [Colwellia sp.]|nr:hypothetical protein [Colwellia sp.]
MLIVISTLTLCVTLQAAPFSLKTLKGENVMAHVNGAATITMIFQPNCSWCKKQGKTLAAVFEECQSSVNVSLVGAKGSKSQLRKALKHYHKSIPAYKADSQFLRTIGGYQASPTTLIYDVDGQLITKKRGFISLEKLAQALKIISQGDCLI